jgi:hypothetical protein
MSENNDSKIVKRSKDIVFPLLLILCGVTLLFNNLGVLDWSVWYVIFSFWPLILIILGLEYVANDMPLAKSIATALAIISFIFVFALSASLVNKTFNNYLQKKLPFWLKVENMLPRERLRPPRIRCNPYFEDCFPYNRWD